MPFLVGIQTDKGEWENYVFHRFTGQLHYTTDVIGRELSRFRYIEAYEGVAKDEMVRLANELNGLPKARRRAAFLERAAGLRIRLQGGTLI